ncbi:hypothetical protein [Sporisorium scitamineum]|uniref:Uncharacterized protein n=1 Tax=Sporisorium scitamineum TaxID=49012 RepID=A0A0F7SBR1_9BASI|nr:hypothetical protein [Sporisorium scitamineum]
MPLLRYLQCSRFPLVLDTSAPISGGAGKQCFDN